MSAGDLRGWPASLGRHRRVGVVERGGVPTHEELVPLGPRLTFDGALSANNRYDGHANATLGLLAAAKAGRGIDGLVQAGGVFVAFPLEVVSGGSVTLNFADAIERASDALSAGDVVLVEAQGSGGRPAEWDADVLDAVTVATASGRHVVIPVGNGSYDLDGTKLDRATQDSESIYVGAGAPPGGYDPARSWIGGCWGGRVDVQGYGEAVVTLAHSQGGFYAPADLYWSGDSDEAYTESFNGTSAASAMVAGLVAVAAELGDRLLGRELTPLELRTMLAASPSGQTHNQNTHPIGPLPDVVSFLEAVWALAVQGEAPPAGPMPSAPTSAQQGALECLATGLTYAEGAKDLGISRSAFSSRVRRLYRRLDVHSRLEALNAALYWDFL